MNDFNETARKKWPSLNSKSKKLLLAAAVGFFEARDCGAGNALHAWQRLCLQRKNWAGMHTSDGMEMNERNGIPCTMYLNDCINGTEIGKCVFVSKKNHNSQEESSVSCSEDTNCFKSVA